MENLVLKVFFPFVYCMKTLNSTHPDG